MNVNIIWCMPTTVLCHLINYQAIYMIKANALIDVSKISLKTFIILAIVADNFVHFNQEPRKLTCKVVIESLRKRSYQFLINQQERNYKPHMSIICSWRHVLIKMHFELSYEKPITSKSNKDHLQEILMIVV